MHLNFVSKVCKKNISSSDWEINYRSLSNKEESRFEESIIQFLDIKHQFKGKLEF